MLKPEDAWERIAAELEPLSGSETLPMGEALGRSLGRDVRATTDVPQADVSAMDGYACAGALPTGSPIPVAGIAAAGSPPDFLLAAGECAKIMTGAVLPEGAERIVPVELSDGGSEQVTFNSMTAPAAHIRRQGEVVRAGAPLLPAGSLLTPGAVSLLASQGIDQVTCRPQPKVSVLATGDEVVPASEQPAPGQLRNSNSPFLLAAGRSLGLGFHPLGIARDDPGDLKRKIARGLEADVFLLTGGVSMGDYDYAEDILIELGCRFLFDKVAVQPGKPLVVARHGKGWVFGLPGNPASVMVTFWLFARPLLRRLCGFEDGFWSGAQTATLTASLPASKGRDRFLPASISTVAGELHATPHLIAGSHDVSGYAHGTALARIHRDAGPMQAGERCQVLPLSTWPASF